MTEQHNALERRTSDPTYVTTNPKDTGFPRRVSDKPHPIKHCMGCHRIEIFGLEGLLESVESQDVHATDHRGQDTRSSGYLSLNCLNIYRESLKLPLKIESKSLRYLSCETQQPNPHYNGD